MDWNRSFAWRPVLLAVVLVGAPGPCARAAEVVVRSARSGPWSAAATWEGTQIPAAGARVLIRPGHTVLYDVDSETAIRGVQVGGTLTFARDRNTLLNVGLLRIAPGDQYSE